MKVTMLKGYRTRDGRDVKLISQNGSKVFPIVGYIDDEQEPSSWTEEGKYFSSHESASDLVEILPPTPLEAAARRLVELQYSAERVPDCVDGALAWLEKIKVAIAELKEALK